jgi:hypothetical protein
MSFASDHRSPRVVLRDTIRAAGAHNVILDGIWDTDTVESWPEVVYAEAYTGAEHHLTPAQRDDVLRAWRRYDNLTIDLPVRITVHPGFALEPLGEGECPECRGTGEGPPRDDGCDDADPCVVCHGRGVVYVTRDVIGGSDTTRAASA